MTIDAIHQSDQSDLGPVIPGNVIPDSWWLVCTLDYLEGVYPTKREAIAHHRSDPAAPVKRWGPSDYELLGGFPGDERRATYYIVTLAQAQRNGWDDWQLNVLRRAVADTEVRQIADRRFVVFCHGRSHTDTEIAPDHPESGLWPREMHWELGKRATFVTRGEADSARRRLVIRLAKHLRERDVAGDGPGARR